MAGGMASMFGGDLLLSIIVGFGIIAAIVVIGFFLLMKSVNDLKNTVTKLESRIENIERRVEDVAKQLEEV